MFIGREKELNILSKKIASDRFEFGIVYGRRRIGKTRLLQEIVKKHDAIYYVANEMGLEYNLKQLSAVVASYFGGPFSFDSFDMLFDYLAQKSKEQQIVLIIDEFTYLISTNPEILSLIQNIIDHSLLSSRLKLILSGSHVGMVEDALSYRKPLYGRTTFKLKLEAFDYFDAAKFYPEQSNEDKIRLFSVFGGVPFYTSKIDASKTVAENIQSLIIEEGAIFEDEITFFLSQEVRSIATYGKVINAIASGATRLNEIDTKSAVKNSGTTSKHLDLLITLGIVEREVCFGESQNSRKTIYRLKDQLFNFHFNFIERNKTQRIIMDAERFYDVYVSEYLDKYVSYEFEQICRSFLLRKYHHSIEAIGRFWQNDAKLKQHIEIDIVMRNANILTAFECKWTNKPIGRQIVSDLERKSQMLGDVELGFFSRSGYDGVQGEHYYEVDDLFSIE